MGPYGGFASRVCVSCLVIISCVQTSIVHTYLEPYYELFVFVICPSVFGLAKARRRKFMLWLKRRSLRCCDAVARNPIEAFFRIFACHTAPCMDAEGYFHAPQSDISRKIECLARKRGFTPRRPSGKEWRYRTILAPGSRMIISRHERAITEQGHAIDSRFYFHVNQLRDLMAPSTTLPALLRKSML